VAGVRARLAEGLAPADAVGRRGAGVLAVAVPCLVWGYVGVLVRELDLPAVTIAGFRLGFAAIGVALGGLALRGSVRLPPRALWRRLLGLGALMALNWWLFILAFQLTAVGVTVVLSFTWPLWVALLSRALRLSAPDRSTLLALLVALVGVGLIAVRSAEPRGSSDLLGMGAALLTAVLMAVMVLLSRSVDERVTSSSVNFWQSLIATVLLAPFALAGVGRGTLDLRALAILALLGMVLTGLGNTLFVHGMRVLSVPETGVLSYLEPVSATVLAALLLDEHPSSRGLLGMVLLVGAGLYVLLRPPQGVSS